MAKPKKWVHFRDRFPRLPIDPEYADVLVALCDAHREKSLAEVTDIYNTVREQREALAHQVSTLQAEETAIEYLLDTMMDRDRVESTVIGDYRFSRMTDIAPVTEDKAKLLGWALEHMRDNLSLHPKVLQSVVKKALEEHEALPEGVGVNTRQTVKRTKA